MKQEKKLGRGLEDFSHVFLSSKSEKIEPPSSTKRDVDSEKEGVVTPALAICIISDREVKERAFLTVNLALEIAKQGKRVLVFDADFSLPRLCMLMDRPEHGSILNFISKNGEEEIIAEYINGVKLITLDVDISDLSSLGASKRTSLTRCFRRAEEKADILLVTTSPSFIHHMIAILKASSDIVVITPQQLHEMINAYGVIKTVFQVNKDACVGIVSSGIDVPDQSEAVFEKMKKIVEKFLDKSIYNYGYIPEDTEISLSIANRKPLSLSSPSSKTVRCIKEISQSILKMYERVREEQSVEGSRSSFTERLFSKASVGFFK
jgi:flagellar biosynthesis protein FlhG